MERNPTSEEIRFQLERILEHPDFRASARQREFLRFVLNESLQGRASQIKGYTIAVTVYGRTDDFDPQVDPIVRVEAGRLRRALEHYYLTVGKNDPVRIEIPKGGYAPVFATVPVRTSQFQGPGEVTEEGEPPDDPSVAVMPFLNLTGDKEQDYFVDGLTEELATELSRYQDFRVIATQSTIRFKGEKVDPKTLGRDLGVQFLLKGSVQQNQKTVKINASLMETSTGTQIWGENYKRDLTAGNLIELQETITQTIIGIIADQYGLLSRRLAAESRKKAPSHVMAYDGVLRFYHYETLLTTEAFENALAALERAVEIEPEYGLAWAMLGHLLADNYALEFCEIEAPLEKALAFAQKGVALAPQNQFARDALTLVYFHKGDKKQFLKHAEETISLNPNAPYIVGVAGWHMSLYGEWNRGLALLKKGMALNPYYPSWFHLATYMHHYHRGLYEEALAEAHKFNYPQLFWDPAIRATALRQLGREDEAKAAVGELLKLEPDFADRGRSLISRYLKVENLIDKLIDDLQKAGLNDMQ